jgi:hypothetical protein
MLADGRAWLAVEGDVNLNTFRAFICVSPKSRVEALSFGGGVKIKVLRTAIERGQLIVTNDIWNGFFRH